MQKTQTLLAILSWRKWNWGIECTKLLGGLEGQTPAWPPGMPPKTWLQGSFCLCSPQKGVEIEKPPLQGSDSSMHHDSHSPGSHGHCSCPCPSTYTRVVTRPWNTELDFCLSPPPPPIFLQSHRWKWLKEDLHLLAIFQCMLSRFSRV